MDALRSPQGSISFPRLYHLSPQLDRSVIYTMHSPRGSKVIHTSSLTAIGSDKNLTVARKSGPSSSLCVWHKNVKSKKQQIAIALIWHPWVYLERNKLKAYAFSQDDFHFRVKQSVSLFQKHPRLLRMCLSSILMNLKYTWWVFLFCFFVNSKV